uniref:Uncharacterized protein n=1 Tax=Candidatus Kentrum sp. FM TaxID=2126340 RepID=A0A450TIC8_9GAMM|nr:MAG: hypothetical protein BECKFM1743C_GA0114222_104445 [Candidatus Kentron sp. FM]VFJ68748.1 MAG: hypothetical protein BECKFM1743A_GA0114220_104824 [Candidatus Kentron sp. FM]VFK17131.1 MAG: hypothetical protein BECKFM1743B_GA0114221_104624 [Candidatus Kentron sp. FM]
MTLPETREAIQATCMVYRTACLAIQAARQARQVVP